MTKRVRTEKISKQQKAYYQTHKKEVDQKKAQYRLANKEALARKQREYYQTNREAYQRYERERKYGMSEEEFLDMFDQQGGRCATCHKSFDTSHQGACIDHCHDTGIVRGLLCSKCNKAIGLADDNPETLFSMAEYLRRVM